MSNVKQFEERGDPWGHSRFAPTEYPDMGGPIERPYNPDFRDPPKPKPNPVDWRLKHRLRTVKGYTHQTIEVERPPAPVAHEVTKVEDTFEHQTKRWQKFIEQERAANAARRAQALARRQQEED